MGEQKAKMDGSVYDRLSGQPGIAAVLDEYYRLLRGDPLFGTLYLKLKQMRPEQTLFLMQITGGPIREADRLIEYAHAGMRVEHGQFDAMMRHLEAALRRQGLEENEAHIVVERAEKMRNRIVL